MHSMIEAVSGATKYGIEYLALVIRSGPEKRSLVGGSVTRCKVDFK